MDINKYIKEHLFEMEDLKYKNFHGGLMRNTSPDYIIGVRIPILKKFVKELVKMEKDNEEYSLVPFLKNLPHQYYEENNVQAFYINQIKDYEECIRQLEEFLPFVDNWATCDSMAPAVLKKYPKETLEKAQEWMASEHAYTIRFGMGCMMRYFLDDLFTAQCLQMVKNAHANSLLKQDFSKDDRYYIDMMTAWYFATALAKQYKDTIKLLENRELDRWTHNKTIQKAIESYRITDEQKEYIRTLRWK